MIISKQVNLHSVHPFPARMAPSIVFDELKTIKNKTLRVLDPMVGSGTVLAVARSQGYISFGFDTDPLALLIAKTLCSDIDEKIILANAEKSLNEASRYYKKISLKEAYPAGCDDETKRFIRYWFDPTNRKQLYALSSAINKIKNHFVRNVLWCAFSRLIIAKSQGASWAMDLSHSRPHKVITKAPFRPIPNFFSAIKRIISNAPFIAGTNNYPKVFIKKGDARSIPLPENSIDFVITSPPYLNAIDYVRCNKFSLVWMGCQIQTLRNLRATNIGAENSRITDKQEDYIGQIAASMGNISDLSSKYKQMLNHYLSDMDKVISEISRVLVPKGKAIIVIGNSTIKQVFIKNSEAFIQLGKKNKLQLKTMAIRDIPPNRRYLPPPALTKSGKSFQTRMNQEVVLKFAKSV